MNMNLACFKKPSRYIGNEVNIIRKDADIKVALCFPDTYEIGMSHIGLKVLYTIINNIPYASAERVFAPWVDLESSLRQNNQPLASLENKRPLKDFDIVGFTLQYELSYTNVLNMLDLGKIPIKTADRGDNHPLIIAGGPCTVNPLPLVPFIDAFVIGDGEEIIGEIIEAYSKNRRQSPYATHRDRNTAGTNRENLLKELAKIKGIFVPLIHDISTGRIERRIVENLESAPFPDAPILPYTSIVHDRVAIEISRGCTKGCRFCQAGMIYRPLRERTVETVLSIAQKSILNTGYEEISFTSLSTGDYSSLLPLIKSFNHLCSDQHIAISLPSLRVGALNREILKEIKSVRKTGFTIAPEAGSKRLRGVINKDFTDEEYEETLKWLFAEGWKNIKLYFMIGLPTETRADIDGIIDMAEMASRRGKEITGSSVNINVGISAFVPKPHTPFQWSGQEPYEELRAKQEFLRKSFKKKGLNFKGQHVELSLLEAVFSRGNKDCASLLEKAWRRGCRFDGWSELFDFNRWLLASEEAGINLYEYASRHLDFNTDLPWAFIDTGITQEFFKSEYQKALRGEITSDCRNICYGCGLSCHGPQGHRQNSDRVETETKDSKVMPLHSMPSFNPIHGSRVVTPQSNSVRIRVKFSKTGLSRYLSHHELMTAILRALRRAKIPVLYSSGFHPHPKISFGPALPVGVEGMNEFFDIETLPYTGTSELARCLNQRLPEGLEVLAAGLITKNERSLNDFISCYEYKIGIDRALQRAISTFMDSEESLVLRDKKTINIRPMVETAEVYDTTLHLMLVDTDNIKVRLYEILQEMFKKTLNEIYSMPIKRTRLYGYNRNSRVEPIEREKVWVER